MNGWATDTHTHTHKMLNKTHRVIAWVPWQLPVGDAVAHHVRQPQRVLHAVRQCDCALEKVVDEAGDENKLNGYGGDDDAG
jgi:hypothetical protein